jgi:hypothetical protein
MPRIAFNKGNIHMKNFKNIINKKYKKVYYYSLLNNKNHKLVSILKENNIKLNIHHKNVTSDFIDSEFATISIGYVTESINQDLLDKILTIYNLIKGDE